MKIFCSVLLLALISAAQAASYQESVGPWTVQFNSSENLTFQKQHNPPSEDGSSIDAIYMLDDAGHQVGWFAFFSYSMLMKAVEENFDNNLNAYINSFKVTSPEKSSIEVDGTAWRMAEGYASVYSRKWRGVAWAFQPFFDSFANTNMTRSYVVFNSLQEEANFKEIIDSSHITKTVGTA